MIYHFTAHKPHFVCHSKSQVFIDFGIYNFGGTSSSRTAKLSSCNQMKQKKEDLKEKKGVAFLYK